MDSDMLIHPGEILSEEFLKPYGLSARRVATALEIPTNRITEIVNGSRGITAETAILLGHAFRTTAEFWINLQVRYDLDRASMRVSPDAIRHAEKFARELCAA